MSFSLKTSSLQHRLSWRLNSGFDEERWVDQLRRTLDEDLDDDETEVPVCIFNVPRSLLAIDPPSYTPQEVAIGPYHHWRSELYEMERYKLSAAKRAQKQFLQSLKFHDFVEQLAKSEQRIRSFYHKYLDFNGETLAWMVSVDASFLLEFLHVYAIEGWEIMAFSRVSSRMSHLVDYEGRKLAHNAILRDVVMLENQIPLFVLKQILELRFPTPEPADEMLRSVLLGLYMELSPFKAAMEDLSSIQISVVSECFHLLDFLYQMIVPKFQDHLAEGEEDDQVDQNETATIEEQEDSSQSLFKQLVCRIWMILSKLNNGPARLLKRITLSKPLRVISNLPWKTLCNFPGATIFKKPFETLTCCTRNDAKETDLEKGSSGTDIKTNRPPLMEEITIPSVSELANSGVGFIPSHGCGISSIAFDAKTATFSLPTVTLNTNSKVVLRNLVAYEASHSSGPLVFTRFTELMNGIIDSEADVKLLRERGIIRSHLKSDAEVAELWNGMSRSIKLTKVGFLDKVIEDVNKHYSSRLKIKVATFVKKTIFGSWPLLTLLAAVLLLFLTALQAFCSVYSCTNLFNFDST